MTQSSPIQQASSISVDTIDVDALHTKTQSVRKELSRHRIAQWFIWGYLILLAFTFAGPTVIFVVYRPSSTELTVDQLKDLLQAFSSALTGITGILGFVVGYYFKGEERADQATKS